MTFTCPFCQAQLPFRSSLVGHCAEFHEYDLSEVLIGAVTSAPAPPSELAATLRDQFAMAALTGILGHPISQGIHSNERVAEYAYEVADAMLLQRKPLNDSGGDV